MSRKDTIPLIDKGKLTSGAPSLRSKLKISKGKSLKRKLGNSFFSSNMVKNFRKLSPRRRLLRELIKSKDRTKHNKCSRICNSKRKWMKFKSSKL